MKTFVIGDIIIFIIKYYHESILYKSLDYQKEVYSNKLTDEQKKYRKKEYR